MRESRLRLSKVAFAGVEGLASPASGATTSGTSSELSLRFMAMVVVWRSAVVWCGLVVFVLAGSFNRQDLNFHRIETEEILPRAVNPETPNRRHKFTFSRPSAL
jgi:hypothetical protein